MKMEYVVRSPPVCFGRTGNWKATFDEKWNRIAKPTAPPPALNNTVMITLNPATQKPPERRFQGGSSVYQRRRLMPDPVDSSHYEASH